MVIRGKGKADNRADQSKDQFKFLREYHLKDRSRGKRFLNAIVEFFHQAPTGKSREGKMVSEIYTLLPLPT
jgi:hypothetical protein